MRNLYLSNLPAPYRMDFYRFLYREMECEICFQDVRDGVPDIPVHRWNLGSLPNLLTAFRPELVIAPEFSAAAVLSVALRKRYGCKVVTTCDDSLDMIRGNDFGWKHRLARHFVPRQLDEIILHSLDVVGWYQERFGKGIFMPIIADERRVRPELARVLPLSAQLRAGDKPVVAFVGRFVGLKNIPSLIRAFEPLKHRAQLVLIGDGPHRTALEAMAPEALFPGMLAGDDLLAWYNLIDIAVLPSTQEAYGAVTGEALMAGAKVVVSEKAGSADLVRERENGYRVPPMDIPALTDRIGRLLDEVPSGRPLTLRENRLPYRFETCIRELIDKLKVL